MRNAIITGASSGIGKAVALELAKNDFSTFLIGRNTGKLELIKNEIESVGVHAHVLQADLSSLADINQLIEVIKKLNVRVDLLANIAGVWHGEDEVYAGKDFETFSQKILLDTYTVGLVAPTLLVHGLIPLMGKESKIINLSGTFESGGKGWIPYFISKRALEDFTVGLAQELEDKNIQVNCISPSDTATDAYSRFFPQYMEDAVDPVEIAKKFVELSTIENHTTGKIIIIKKDMQPFEGFHY